MLLAPASQCIRYVASLVVAPLPGRLRLDRGVQAPQRHVERDLDERKDEDASWTRECLQASSRSSVWSVSDSIRHTSAANARTRSSVNWMIAGSSPSVASSAEAACASPTASGRRRSRVFHEAEEGVKRGKISTTRGARELLDALLRLEVRTVENRELRGPRATLFNRGFGGRPAPERGCGEGSTPRRYRARGA